MSGAFGQRDCDRDEYRGAGGLRAGCRHLDRGRLPARADHY